VVVVVVNLVRLLLLVALVVAEMEKRHFLEQLELADKDMPVVQVCQPVVVEVVVPVVQGKMRLADR
jgi:hypothetical protein